MTVLLVVEDRGQPDETFWVARSNFSVSVGSAVSLAGRARGLEIPADSQIFDHDGGRAPLLRGLGDCRSSATPKTSPLNFAFTALPDQDRPAWNAGLG